MFEAQVAFYLNKYLGRYVAGIDTESLKISVWKGDVELRNLVLKPEALAGINLPITVKSGLLGKLTLKVWARARRGVWAAIEGESVFRRRRRCACAHMRACSSRDCACGNNAAALLHPPVRTPPPLYPTNTGPMEQARPGARRRRV